MGLLQRAIETYDANASLIGVYREDHDPLAPIGHTVTSAAIEITLNSDGTFLTAREVGKREPKIVIPVTEESGGRTSALAAHPLCDQLKYVAPPNAEAHELYLNGLQDWLESAHSHPFLSAVFAYVSGGTILEDLTKCGILAPDAAWSDIEKKLVRWRILGLDDEEAACWRNQKLFSAFISYYCERIAARDSDLCMIDGRTETLAAQHPKGIIPVNGNAKLISANDESGFTYRGRFADDRQAATVSYIASQKAHNALRWLASEEGVREFSGNRIFLCWNPKGKALLKVMRRVHTAENEVPRRPSDYQARLQSTLLSFRKDHQLDDSDCAILASFDAATAGRLAVTYYNEISLKTFLERMHDWDAHCCWYAGSYGIQAPNLLQIVDRAFGAQRKNGLETDNRIQRQHLQRLLSCKMSGSIFLIDILRALTQRASSPLAYSEADWRKIVQTACAALQKYRYDTKQGGNEMAWELDKRDRSFQYGRLLAAMERAEADYYYKTQEARQTNAVKFMAEFRQRPFSVFERLNRHLHQAYLDRVDPWQAARYERLVGEIFEILRDFPENELNQPLEDLYLMGYELQRNAFFTKKDTENNTEEE